MYSEYRVLKKLIGVDGLWKTHAICLYSFEAAEEEIEHALSTEPGQKTEYKIEKIYKNDAVEPEDEG